MNIFSFFLLLYWKEKKNLIIDIDVLVFYMKFVFHTSFFSFFFFNIKIHTYSNLHLEKNIVVNPAQRSVEKKTAKHAYIKHFAKALHRSNTALSSLDIRNVLTEYLKQQWYRDIIGLFCTILLVIKLNIAGVNHRGLFS